MPYGDRTGPDGMGPMTGRGLGFCAGYAAPGALTGGRGRGGFGRYGSGGRGVRNRFWQSGGGRFSAQLYNYGPYEGPGMTPADEKESLRNEARFMQQSLDEINRRLSELENRDTQVDEK